jgi:NitT/TauT family transport system substrate-binding protein
MGSLNMVFCAHRDTIAGRPELVKVILDIHRKASDFGMANPEAMITMAVAKLGQKREALAVSISNVELNWKMTPEMVQASKTYAEHMLALKQIKVLPDFATFFDSRFSDALTRA